MAEFVAVVRKIAKHCEYDDILEDMLHDRVMFVVSDKCVQYRLLQETKDTYKQPLDVTLAVETANQDTKCI